MPKPFYTRSENEDFIDVVGMFQSVQPKESEATKLRRRIGMLRMTQPNLTSDPAALLELANMPGSTVDMIESADAGLGYMQIQQTVDEMNSWDEKDRREYLSRLPANQQQALAAGGLNVPSALPEEPGNALDYIKKRGVVRGILGYQGKILGTGAGLAGKGLQIVTGVPLLKQGLQAMTWLGEAATTIPRTQEQYEAVADFRLKLEQQGIDPDAYAAERGIELPNAQPNRGKLFGAIPLPGAVSATLGSIPAGAPAFMNPKDVWKLWKMQGVEGDDDFLIDRKFQTYDELEEIFGDQTPQAFQRVLSIASGRNLAEIAEEEGYEPNTPAFQDAVDELARFSFNPDVKRSVAKLVGGRMSPGRGVARRFGYTDEDLSDWSSPARYISGSIDATYAVVADPTNLAAGAGKAARAARWAVKTSEGMEDVQRAQRLAQLAARAEELSAYADDAAEVAEGVTVSAAKKELSDALKSEVNRNVLGRRSVIPARDALAEGKAYHRANKLIAQAFDASDETYTLAQLARDLPNVKSGMHTMVEWHNQAKTGVWGPQLSKGLADPNNVPYFFMDRSAMAQLVQTKALGKNPHHLFLPKVNVADRWRTAGKQFFTNLKIDGKTPLPQEAVDDIEEAVTEAVEETAQAQLPVGKFDDLLNWQPQGRNPVRKFRQTFTTLTPKHNYVPLSGQDAFEEASKFFEFGNLINMPQAAKDKYLEMFARGNVAERAAVVNQFLSDFFVHAGAIDPLDEAGKHLLEKHVAHMNQAYGIADPIVLRTTDDVKSLTRAALMSSQLTDQVAIPSFRELQIATRRANTIRRVFGGINNSRMFEAVMGRGWIPAILMRPGFIIRNAGEEILSHTLRESGRSYLRAKFGTELARNSIAKAKGVDPAVAALAADRPLAAAADGVRSIVMMTDEEILERTHSIARTMPDYGLSPKRDAEIITEAREQVLRSQGKIPKTLRWMDNFAKFLATTKSKGFHELAEKAHLPDKATIGKAMLGDEASDYLLAEQMLLNSEIGEHAWGEMLGKSTFARATGAAKSDARTLLLHDPTSPTGLAEIKMKVDMSNFKWTGQGDIGTYYWKLNSELDMVASSPEGMAGLRSMMSFVGPKLQNDLKLLFGREGMDVANELQQLAARYAKDEYAGELIREFLKGRKFETHELKNMSENGIDDLADAFAKLQEGPTRVRYMLSPHMKGKLIGDPEFQRQRLAQNIYNRLRTLSSQDDIRRLIRAHVYNGSIVAEPIPEGVRRLYLPMVDRRSAEGLQAVFSSSEGASTLAKHLEAELTKRGLKSRIKPLWDAASPSYSGWTVEDFMNMVQGNRVMEGGEWMPAALVGTSNPEIARAVRDAMKGTLDELGVPNILPPTLGYTDVPIRNMEKDYGFHVTESDDIVHMEAFQAIKVTPIDPSQLVTLHKVKLEDGRFLWVGDQEMERVLSMPARARTYKTATNNKSEKLVRWNERFGRFDVNTQAIKDDWAAGAKYLKGNGATKIKRVPQYTYGKGLEDDIVYAKDALDDLIVNDEVLPTLDEYITKYKGMRKDKRKLLLDGDDSFANDPHWGPLLADDRLRATIAKIAEKSKKSGAITETVEAVTEGSSARLVNEALTRMGIDVDKLVDTLTESEYVDFLTLREQAHKAMGHRWVRTDVISDEKILIDQQASAFALKQMGWSEDAIKRISSRVDDEGNALLPDLPVPKFDKKGVTILDTIVGSGITEDVAVKATAEGIADEVLALTIGRESGDAMHEIVHHLVDGDYSMRDLFIKGSTRDLPEKVYGPTLVTPNDTRWSNLTNTFFEGIASPAISALSRTPLFRFHIKEAMQHTKFILDNMIVPSLDEQTRRVLSRLDIDPKDLEYFNRFGLHRAQMRKVEYDRVGGEIDEWVELGYHLAREEWDLAIPHFTLATGGKAPNQVEMELIAHWMQNQNVAFRAWQDATLQRAYNMTIPFIDDHRVRSQFQEYVGRLIPFWYSEEQFLKRMAYTLIQTPNALRKGQLMMGALRDVGVIREDENGNEVFVYPGSELATGTIGKVAEIVTGDTFLLPKSVPLAARTDYMIPGYNSDQAGKLGLGPWAGLSIEFLSRRFPEWEAAQKGITGWDGSRAYWEYLVPGSISTLYKGLLSTADKGSVASAQADAIKILEATGHGLPENATVMEKEQYLENLETTARTIFVLRSATNFFGGATASPLYVEQAQMSKEFRDLLAQGVSMETALELFIEQYGPNAAAFSVFKTENLTHTKLPATEQSYQFMIDNESLFTNYPSAAAYLLPPGDHEDEFSARAYKQQLAMGLRSERTPEDVLRSIYEQKAAPEYYKKKDEYDARIANAVGDEKEKLQAEWEYWSKAYQNQHPAFADSIGSNEGRQRRLQIIEQMNEILLDPNAPKSKSLDAIRPLLQNFNNYQATMEAMKSERGKAAMEAKRDLTDRFYTYAWSYTRKNRDAESFWFTVLRPTFDDADLYDMILKEGE